MVGNRRVYGEDTIKRLANTPTAKYLGLKQAAFKSPTPTAKSSRKSSASEKSVSVLATSETKGRPSHDTVTDAATTQRQSINLEIRTGRESIGSTKLPDITVKNLVEEVAIELKPKVESPASQRKLGEPASVVPCPYKPLTSILGDTETVVPLTPLKKPKDLLTPMVKIIDEKSKSTQGKE